MKILTAQQMRKIDRLAVELCGIPSSTLMETAGARVVDEIVKRYGSVQGKSFAVYCGKGNNGGDGAVIARLLWLRLATKVSLYLFGRLDETSGEARTNFEAVKKIAEDEAERQGPIQHLFFQEITEATDVEYLLEYPHPNLVIDALLGTGLTRPAEGHYARAIEWVNDAGYFAKVVSVDIPSGLSSDREHPIGPHVRANLTVSFTAPKIGNVLPPACYANGDLVIAQIGTPSALLQEEAGTQLELLIDDWVKATLLMSRRPVDAHKGSVGTVLLVAGSRGKTGAAALAAETILRSGAGLVTVATARSAQSLLVAQARPEVMTEALEETESGAISHAALDHALRLAEKCTAIAIGPGLSSSDQSTRRFVREFVEDRTAPLVIDADGLNALAPWPEDLKGSGELPIIITPHPGEMARLTGKTNAEIIADRVGVARGFATKHHVITVLKGNRTIIAGPQGDVYLCPTGNAGMATGGAGDVLTGLIAGLIAQDPALSFKTAAAAVYLHGFAGDIAADKFGLRSLIASDIIAHLSEAILRLGHEERGQRNTITMI